jgi:preprotein translocase SecE subunit
VARNRKRAKERRSRRPQSASQPGLATARANRDDHNAPDPIAHAAPDAELAEAQMALGRPGLAQGSESESESASEVESDLEPAEDLEQELSDGRSGEGNGGLVPSEAGHPARAAPTGNRLVNFIRGSWRELQRVQWPDRRQVVQATSVVIGFVIVAGVYLGVADWAAGKIVNLIIK